MRKKSPKVCESCPIAKVAHIVGDLWTILIIRDLLSGPKRFNELALSLEGVSTRTLAQKLKDLESASLLSRKEYTETPPRVEYTLTKKGVALRPLIKAMKGYSEKFA